MNTKIENLCEILRQYNACPDASEWVAAQTGTPQQVWESCERGDWLLWIAARIGVDRKLIVTAACLCAREALVHVTVGENRPLIAIQTTERWTRGEASLGDVRVTASALAYAVNVSYCVAYYAAYYAANAAANVSYCVAHYVPRYAANAAATAAYPAVNAAYCVAGVATRAVSLARSADLVRSVISWSVVETAIGGGATTEGLAGAYVSSAE